MPLVVTGIVAMLMLLLAIIVLGASLKTWYGHQRSTAGVEVGVVVEAPTDGLTTGPRFGAVAVVLTGTHCCGHAARRTPFAKSWLTKLDHPQPDLTMVTIQGSLRGLLTH